MSIVLSNQGCMAVGKTTALKYIEVNAPYINISYENNRHIINRVMERQLNKNIFADYIEIQKLWIQNEISRWEEAQKYDCTIMDFGAEEIEFYTFAYPKTIGADWDVEACMHEELEKLRRCMPDRILYLDASEDELRNRKVNDKTNDRKFFEYYIKNLLPLKKEWFIGKENVDVLNVDDLGIEEVGELVRKWIDYYRTELK